MSDYEFMRNIPFGQYLPIDSPIHRLDSRAKILVFFFILLALVLSRQIWGQVIGLICLLIALPVARLSIRYALRSLITPLPFLLILVVLQILFNNQPDSGVLLIQLSRVQIYASDIWVGMLLLTRFASLIIGLTFATQCLSTSELTRGLESLLSPLNVLHLPVRDGVMTLQIAIRFVPLLAQVAERIAKAQAARGAGWQKKSTGLINRSRMVIPLLIPLFVVSMRKADNMALAMDSRGYGGPTPHTSMVEMKFRWVDGVAIFISILIALAVLKI